MTNDPIVREVREIRHEIERECQGESEAFYKWLLASQQKLTERLVCRQPKLLVSEQQKKAS